MSVWVASASLTERALMVAALAEEGFEARGFESPADLTAVLAQGQSPEVLVLDAGGFDLKRDEWDTIKLLAPEARTILITGAMGDLMPADHTLRRPLSIGELAGRIKRITGGTL
jgi:DNA-binding response OmpR family regulator